MKQLVWTVLAVVGMAVSAASVDVAQVGTKKYSNFAAAVNALSSESPTLTLLANCTTSPIQLKDLDADAITIDLGGKTLTVLNCVANTVFLKNSKKSGDDDVVSWNGTCVITNGAVSMKCAGFLELIGDGNAAVLEDVTVTSTGDASKFMVYVCGNLSVTRCAFAGTASGGVATVGGVGDYADSTFSVKRLPTGVALSDTANSCRASCVFSARGATINISNCRCYGATEADPAPYSLYEAYSYDSTYKPAKLIPSTINVKSGLYNGPMMMDCFDNAKGAHIYGGVFSNCTFMTRSGNLDYRFYHISGGAFDENPLTNGCKYIEQGYFVEENPDAPGTWKVDRLDWSVSGTNVVYDGTTYGVTPHLVNPATADLKYALAKNGPYQADPFAFKDVTNQTVWVILEKLGFEAATNSATVTIAKRPVTLTSGSQTWTYDGNFHSNMTVTVSGDGFVSGESVLTNTFKRVKESGPAVSNTFNYAEGPLTSTNNYDITVKTGELRILPADTAGIWIAAKAITNDYTGVAQTNVGFEIIQSTAAAYQRSDFVFTGCSNLVATTAGTYKMNLQPTDFTPAADSAFQKLTVHVVQDGELVINKVAPKRIGGQPVDPVEPDPQDPLKPFSSYDVTAGYDGRGHTIDTNALKQLQYEPPSELSLSYALTTNEPVAWQPEPFVFTNVVTTSFWYRVSSSGASDFIHPAKLTVTNRLATLTSGSQTWVWDGLAHSNMTVVAKGFVEGEGVVTNGFATITAVGAVSNAFAYAAAEGTDLANYTITRVTGELRITASPKVTVMAGPGGTAAATAGVVGGCGVPGKSVSVTAYPTADWQFRSWSGDAISGSTANPATFTMPSTPVTVTANFEVSSDLLRRCVDGVNTNRDEAAAAVGGLPLDDEVKSPYLKRLDDGAARAKAEISAASTPADARAAADGADESFVTIYGEAAKRSLANSAQAAKTKIDGLPLTQEEKAAAAERIDEALDLANAAVDAAASLDQVTFVHAAGEAAVEEVVETAAEVARTRMQFDVSKLEAVEGEEAELVVWGGSDVQSVQATLLLVKGTLTSVTATMEVDGGMKKARFPLTLAWEKGDTEPKTIYLSTKKSRRVEADRFLTFQLSAPAGAVLGPQDVCTFTVRDADEPKADETPYVRALAWPANDGTVSGAGTLPRANSTRTLMAKAKRWSTFAGWCRACTNDANRIDTNALVTTARKLKVGQADAGTYFAWFADGTPVITVVDPDFSDEGTVGVKVVDGVATCTVGSYVEFGLDFVADDFSKPKLTVTRLPSGLKYDKKTGLVSGVPKRSGVFTVTVKGQNVSGRHTIFFDLVVEPLPDEMVGTFEGDLVDSSTNAVGSVKLKVTAQGKLAAQVKYGRKSYSYGAGGFVATENSDVVLERGGSGAIELKIGRDEEGEPDGTYRGLVEDDVFGDQRLFFEVK